MLLSLFIVSVVILLVCETAEGQKRKKIQKQNTFMIKYLQRMK
jgi:hypothetical protein